MEKILSFACCDFCHPHSIAKKCKPKYGIAVQEVWFTSPSSGATVSPLSPNPFVVPQGVSSVNVKMVGGGGGGSTSLTAGGGGGGAGAFIGVTIPVCPGNTFTVSVGTGGAIGVAGTNTTVTGPGGLVLTAGGGGTSTNQFGGAGGVSSIISTYALLSSVSVPGQNGSDVTPLGLEGLLFPTLGGSGGGSSFASAGGASPGENGTQTGGLFGGGGSGVSLSGTPSQATPATAGADGCVVLTYSQVKPIRKTKPIEVCEDDDDF